MLPAGLVRVGDSCAAAARPDAAAVMVGEGNRNSARLVSGLAAGSLGLGREGILALKALTASS